MIEKRLVRLAIYAGTALAYGAMVGLLDWWMNR